MLENSIKNKLVLITGASSGIGEETARLFAKAGAKVILIARNLDKINELASIIKNNGGIAYPISLDISNYIEVIEKTAYIKKEIGVPDIIINNAGSGIWKSTEDTKWEDISNFMAVPYFGAFYMVKAFINEMLERKRGHIVNMTSYAGFIQFSGATAYIVARKAMIGFHEALSADLYKTGIKCSLAYFAKVTSSYWENNPGSEEKLPGAQSLIRVISPQRAAKALLNGVIHRKKHIYTPPIIALFNLLIRFTPFITRWLIYSTGYKRKPNT
jgi:short-subunit dehydrogenase